MTHGELQDSRSQTRAQGMPAEWVLIEVGEPAGPAEEYRPAPVGQVEFQIAPRAGEYGGDAGAGK